MFKFRLFYFSCRRKIRMFQYNEDDFRLKFSIFTKLLNRMNTHKNQNK